MAEEVKKLITISESTDLVCDFCKTSEVDKLVYGDLYALEDVVTHYYCMLFASGLKQRGKDHEGIMGFILEDINREKRRGSRLICQFCTKKGATIGCAIKRCNQMYHFHCGLANEANFQFHSRFESYCVKHCPVQKVVLAVNDPNGNVCPICLSVADDDPFKIVPRCCRGALFHKSCLQIQALNSGYFFKCPMCNDNKLFISEMKNLGIFVPLKDASWETEPNAFEELHIKHSTCDTDPCKCPTGNKTKDLTGDFSLAICINCGAAGTHKLCARIRSIKNWSCAFCLESLKKFKSSTSSSKSETTSRVVVAASRKRANKIVTKKPVKRPRVDPYDLPIDFSLLKMSKYVFKYFPYNKNELKQFESDMNIPNWKNLSLKVNLVNNIPNIKTLLSQKIKEQINRREKIETIVNPSESDNSGVSLTTKELDLQVHETENEFSGTIEGDLRDDDTNKITVDVRANEIVLFAKEEKVNELDAFQVVREMKQRVDQLNEASAIENQSYDSLSQVLNDSMEERFMINNNIDMEHCSFTRDEEFISYDQDKMNEPDDCFYEPDCRLSYDDIKDTSILDEVEFSQENAQDFIHHSDLIDYGGDEMVGDFTETQLSQ